MFYIDVSFVKVKHPIPGIDIYFDTWYAKVTE